MIRVISLGAGVQSTTMALMASRGDIGPMPDCAIFADTGWEPRAVYDHLRWLTSHNVLRFPVHIVSNGNIREDVLNRRNTSGGQFAVIPWFIVNPDGSRGIGRRQCTHEYKLKPISWKLRELLGVDRKGRLKKGAAEVWIGISTDEAARMKPSDRQWQVNRWPLIEKNMSRTDCLRWLEKSDYPRPPKSSCIGCPFHGAAAWREMHLNQPVEFADAVAVDKALREGPARAMRGQEFMHAARKPLDQVDLSNAEDRGQLNMFINECEGMCGV